MYNLEDLSSLINENTKVIWLETPTNPMINVYDIEAISKISKKLNICADLSVPCSDNL